jgi:2-keto-4-pentenoate hydratase/2-oxohepta-3-ene-1,7-dioic acid hydratase in catechol pathway
MPTPHSDTPVTLQLGDLVLSGTVHAVGESVTIDDDDFSRSHLFRSGRYRNLLLTVEGVPAPVELGVSEDCLGQEGSC